MKKVLFVLIGMLFSLSVYADAKDPMGLSEYVISEAAPVGSASHYTGSQSFYKGADGSYWHDRRLTNHEAEVFQQLGFINPDGSMNTAQDSEVRIDPLQPVGSQAVSAQTNVTPTSATPAPKQHKSSQVNKKQMNTKDGIKHAGYPKHPRIKKKALPTSHEIASKTKTKHASHPKSNGTAHVRPTNMPKNPSRDDIVRMQQHIQHIERQVAKALDLSLSAYAVAELPQATEGRSSVSFGGASADGETAAAVGYSSNFGAKHEYTVKISLSHAGHEEAMGAGIGYQW